MRNLRPLSILFSISLTGSLAGLLAGCPGESMSGLDAGAVDMTQPAIDMTPTMLSARAMKGLSISPFAVATAGLSIAQQEKLGIGSYLVNAVGGCNDCHAQNVAGGPPKFLGGGNPFQLPTGTVYGRNLTSDATTGLRLTEAQFVEALRTGKDWKSSSMNELLLVMPWYGFRWMSTDDIKSVYAYLQLVPAINNPVPNDIKGAAAALTPVAFPSSYNEGDVSRPLPPETEVLNSQRGLALQPLADPAGLAALSQDQKNLFGRGAYLVAAGGCNDCHTNPERDFTPGANFLKINTAAYLSGGRVFAVPPGLNSMLMQTRTMSANLSGMTNGMNLTYQQFSDTLVQLKHVTKPGMPNLGFPMPGTLKDLVDEDRQALYLYLTTISRRTAANDKATQAYARYCTMDTQCNMAGGETCNMTNKECIGKTCAADKDCDACQTCGAGNKCAAPASGSACLTSGI